MKENRSWQTFLMIFKIHWMYKIYSSFFYKKKTKSFQRVGRWQLSGGIFASCRGPEVSSWCWDRVAHNHLTCMQKTPTIPTFMCTEQHTFIHNWKFLKINKRKSLCNISLNLQRCSEAQLCRSECKLIARVDVNQTVLKRPLMYVQWLSYIYAYGV